MSGPTDGQVLLYLLVMVPGVAAIYSLDMAFGYQIAAGLVWSLGTALAVGLFIAANNVRRATG